jgi:isocitrate lyase
MHAYGELVQEPEMENSVDVVTHQKTCQSYELPSVAELA